MKGPFFTIFRSTGDGSETQDFAVQFQRPSVHMSINPFSKHGFAFSSNSKPSTFRKDILVCRNFGFSYWIPLNFIHQYNGDDKLAPT